MAHGQIRHIELPADDTARACSFYAELFGWEFTEMDGYPGYFLFRFEEVGASGGAIGERGKTTGERLRIFIDTDSIDDVLGRVEQLGGSIVEPKTEVTGQGWSAVIIDSEGNEVALFEGSDET